MRQWSVTMLCALMLSQPACSSSQFAGLGGRSQGDTNEDSADIKDGKATSQANKKEAAQDLDDPQQVAGSFLTLSCAEDPAREHSDQDVTVGCVVKDSDGNMADLSGASNQQWSLISPLNFIVDTPIVEEPEGSTFHRTLKAPRDLLAFYAVRTTFKIADKERELAAFINPAKASSAESTPPPIVEVGQDEDFQLGDDNWVASANRGCTDRLQAVNISGHTLTAVVHVKSATAKVGISLRDMCGVTYRSNVVGLFKNGQRIAGGDIRRYATDFTLSGVELDRGDYQLSIESRVDNSEGGDRDDFIIGKIVVTSDGDVTIDRPTAPAP